MSRTLSFRPTLAAALGLLLAPACFAHDTWFAPSASSRGKSVLLTLGTGNRFPVHEFGVAAEHLAHSGCRTSAGRPVSLQARSTGPTALDLRVAKLNHPGEQALTCWAQLIPFDIEIAPAKVAVYLDEINASPAVRGAWAGQQARGVAWQERYTKHARIELAGSRRSESSRAVDPSMGMDVLLQPSRTPIRPGDALTFQVVRDGVPLSGQAVELRGDRSPLGFWQRTDAQGLAHFTAPLSGRWVLRGTDLRLSEHQPDRWESRFVTLAFEIEDKPAARTAAP
jgi:uncharacterized GH25 family protein